MGRLKYLFLGILALMLSGCGQTIVETLNIPAGQGSNGPGVGKTIVILPFADYSYADNLSAAYRRNLAVTETLTDRLVANGFGLPIQEDVFRYLVEQNIISIAAYEEITSPSLENELEGEWSSSMKAEISKYLQKQQLSRTNKVTASPGTHGLTRETVAKLGRVFDADYVVRGRILEFRTRQEGTWAPWKRGVLPFITGTTSKMLWGHASSNTYDTINQTIAGASVGAGAALLTEIDAPYNHNDTLFGSGITPNTIIWGAAGAVAGYLSDKSGRIDQAAVQLRVWIQEAATGNVVWTNRVDVKVAPKSVLADKQYDVLFDKAINKGVSTLIDDFVTYGL